MPSHKHVMTLHSIHSLKFIFKFIRTHRLGSLRCSGACPTAHLVSAGRGVGFTRYALGIHIVLAWPQLSRRLWAVQPATI